MNVFILCTGRCGSTTFIKACSHITNYTSAHESRSHLIGEEHFQYPSNHIEADNRLSWFLGKLEKLYGDTALYVHLLRDRKDTAESLYKRYHKGIMQAYTKGIIMYRMDDPPDISFCYDYIDTVNTNIEIFLQDKSKKINFQLENAEQDFKIFWEKIKAQGDIETALSEWNKIYNATPPITQSQNFVRPNLSMKMKKALRLISVYSRL